MIALFALGWSVVAVALSLIVRGTPAERGMAALVKAYRLERPIEPRLSGGLGAAGFDASVRGPSNASSADRDTAEELLTEVATQRDDGYAQLAYGRFLLTELRASDALKRLDLAVERLPRSADALNDLGACLFEQGKPEDALEKLNRALEIDPKMPEALFNRALCYERLLLTDAASEEFAALLHIEHDTGWQNEVLQKVRATKGDGAAALKPAQIVASFDEAIENQDLAEAGKITRDNLEVINKHVVERVPEEFLKESLTGDADKMRRALFEIQFAGKQLLAATGDTSTADLASYMAQLSEKERASELALFAEYKRADQTFNDRRYREARSASERVERQFRERGNLVYQQFAGYIVASSLYGEGELNQSVTKLREILEFVKRQTWPYRQVQSLSLLGLNYSRLGNDSLGLKYCEQATRFGSSLPQFEAKVCQYLSSVYFRLGDLDKRLEYLRKSTRLYLTGVPSSSDLANNFVELASLYSVRGNHELALSYALQALTYARQAGDNGRAAQAASMAAVELARLGRFKRAEEELNRAFSYIELADATRQKQYTESVVRRRGGELELEQGNIAQALDYYNEAEALVKNSEDHVLPLIRVLRGRAEAYIRAEEFEKARTDLDSAANLLQQYRDRIDARSSRSDFLDANSSVFDQLIELDAGILGHCEDAFDVLEQSRARALLDEFQSAEGGGKPLQLQAVKDNLPAGFRLLAYSVTGGGTYIFLVTREGCSVTRTPATTELLDRLVHDYVLALKTRGSIELVRQKGRDLYDRLIAPVEDQLGETKDLLCIVPDKALHFLPFAALVDPSGRYLIESRRLIYAPSASVLVQCIKESGRKATEAPESILAVGNPTFNRDAFPDLDDLLDAEREARAIADQYDPKGGTRLIGPDATKERVLSTLGKSDVVHLATHCQVEGNASWLAALVLADPSLKQTRELSSSVSRPERSRDMRKKGPGDAALSKSSHADAVALAGDGGTGAAVLERPGLLYLDDIYKTRSGRTRLVVLSACQSGLGQYFRGEGIVSLVRPFLAMRVPTVVASLWSVESNATADLMIDFHKRHRAGGLGAADALREAQISMSQSVSFEHPYYWAPFIAVGSNK